MKDKYAIYSDKGLLENAMSRDEAIEKVKQYCKEGINAYIVSETEGKRIKESKQGFQPPKWQ